MNIIKNRSQLVALLVFVISFSWFFGYGFPQNNADEIVGVWMTQSQESMVEIYKTGDTYSGKILWLKFPISPVTGKPKVDNANPDKKLRDRPSLGLVLMTGFKYSAKDKEWNEGTIYDPKSGSTYKCKATLIDKNTLNVRGYIAASWMGLGRTEMWKKIK